MTTTSSIGRTPYERTLKKLFEINHGEVFQTLAQKPICLMMMFVPNPRTLNVTRYVIYLGEGKVGNMLIPLESFFGENWDHIQVELLDCHIQVAGK